MDFSNFGKIKKIFYIVAIISMLLSIKTKVFGASYSADYQGVIFEFNDNFNNNNPYYCLFVSNDTIYGSYYARLYRSNSPMNVNLTSSRITIYNNNNDGLSSFFGTITSLSNYLQDNGFDNNPIPSTR